MTVQCSHIAFSNISKTRKVDALVTISTIREKIIDTLNFEKFEQIAPFVQNHRNRNKILLIKEVLDMKISNKGCVVYSNPLTPPSRPRFFNSKEAETS